MARKIFVLLTFSLLFSTSITSAFAFDIGVEFFDNTPAVTKRPDDLSDIYNPIIGTVYMVAGIIALASLIYGGYSYIMGANSGDSKQIEQGRKAIMWAFIGLAALFSVFWIVQIVEILLGLQDDSILNPTI